jgi:DNA adenine methylase
MTDTRLVSPIGWLGGKSRMRKYICQLIPKHDVYVELFAGGAWVLFAKSADTSLVEVINDRNDALVNFWRCLRDHRLELIDKLRFRLLSQRDFYRVRDRKTVENMSEIDRAAEFYWTIKMSFGSKQGHRSWFGYAKKGGTKPLFNLKDHVLSTLEAAQARLAEVYIFNEDFEAVMDRFDSSKTFFYADPPYYGCETAYDVDFSGHHDRLAERLRTVKGSFCLSYNDHAEVRRLYSWATIDSVDTRYSVNKAHQCKVTELLIRNY